MGHAGAHKAAGVLMKHTRNIALRRPLAAMALAALVVAGCTSNPSSAPTTPPAANPPPVGSSAPPAEPQTTAFTWARSMCQALHPALTQLGKPPQPDVNDPAATRQAFITYLTQAGNATQQTIDRLSSIGAPPVDNGQQILEEIRTQLVELRTNLLEVATRLKAANPNDTTAIGQAFGVAGNVVGLVGALATNPQLRA
ncbi:MAG: hypothetical protein QOG46_1328, partial [Pseudonocardiales bacterium]|nr:hypothetical protein [Pseudonocardiales bacterium]